jgi:hypothetical protein
MRLLIYKHRTGEEHLCRVRVRVCRRKSEEENTPE